MDKQKFADGPVQDRKPTDEKWGLAFFGTTGVVFLVSIICMAKGNTGLMSAGQDADRRVCGYHADVVDYPFAYWTL